MLNLKPHKGCKSLHVSPQGMAEIMEKLPKAQYPGQHVLWTDDIRAEIPIRIGNEGIEGVTPCTVIDAWRENLEKFGNLPAQSVKRGGQWVQRV